MDKMRLERAIERLEMVPCLRFGHRPTPIEELPRLRAVLGGGPRILMKRDDYLGPGFGGNKVRKLEYLLEDAKLRGVEVVITCGGEKSNHARVTAAMCARLGMGCVLVLNPAARGHAGLEPANLALDRLYGAEVHRVAGRAERAATMESLAEEYRRSGRVVEVVPLGGSVALGALGLVAAAAEVAEQLRAKSVEIDYLFHCSSSGGTQAGLAVGRQLFPEIGRQLIGVSPDDEAGAIASVVGGIVRGIGERLGFGVGELDERVTVDDGYVGEGYGIPTPECEEAIGLLARTEGIVLDPVYTGKAMAALLGWIRAGRLAEDETVLFWHTGGQLALFYVPEGGV